MKSTKKLNFVFVNCLVFTAFSLSSAEPVCHRCEEIREYNAEHHENYEYYEDYIKTENNEKPTGSKTYESKNRTK